MVGSVGGDGGQVESDAGDRSADDDPWRALAETAVGGVGQRAEDDVGDQGEDDADGVHRAEDRFALTDAERVEAGWSSTVDPMVPDIMKTMQKKMKPVLKRPRFSLLTGLPVSGVSSSAVRPSASVFFGAIAAMIPFGYWFTFANTHEIASMKPAMARMGAPARFRRRPFQGACAQQVLVAHAGAQRPTTAWPPTSPSTCSATPI